MYLFYERSVFQSTPSAWRETHFLHRLSLFHVFQSTPSAWRETLWSESQLSEQSDFNPLPPHGGRHFHIYCDNGTTHISIHSLRMEGDVVVTHIVILYIHFNPLPPHGGRRNRLYLYYISAVFQSTPSAWRETSIIEYVRQRREHFNPLPPHGGRPFTRGYADISLYFNPLPPHGGRHNNMEIPSTICSFQSTPSAWRETVVLWQNYVKEWISIHSLRMEGDILTVSTTCNQHHFNPLPPHGGRQHIVLGISILLLFQSTPSAWRETDSI